MTTIGQLRPEGERQVRGGETAGCLQTELDHVCETSSGASEGAGARIAESSAPQAVDIDGASKP